MLNPRTRDKMQADAGRREHEEGREAPTIIVHVDMDAFFAAIEERDNPNLRGHPVIIGGPKGSRGVVTTCNYVAREFGIHAGMSLTEAGRRCPDGIYLRTHGQKYTDASLHLMRILRRFSPRVEPYSIDEAFLDATGCVHLWGDAAGYGQAIRDAIRKQMRMTASVGIGSTRVIAKMASSLKKPDGLAIISEDDERSIFGPMPVETIPGVGKATRRALSVIGVYTIDELADCPVKLLKSKLGIGGETLSRIARGGGREARKITPMEERPDDKSMSHEHTFVADVHFKDALHSRLMHLCEKLTRRIRREGYYGDLVTLRLRTSDFLTRTHQGCMPPEYSQDPVQLLRIAKRLLADIWNEGQSVRLIGVCVSGLQRIGNQSDLSFQGNLFDTEANCRHLSLFRTVDHLLDMYGDDVLGFASGSRIFRQ